MNLSLQNLEQFMALLHNVERVKRFVHRPGEHEQTNTGEHTFELALLCWYIASCEKLDLSHEKIIKYALAHDVIEAYAGDTPAYDKVGQKNKAEREHAAFLRLQAEFFEFPELMNAIETYEAKADEESRFVYAVDKLIDPLAASLETVLTHWREKGVTYSDMRTYKDAKVATNPLFNRTGESSAPSSKRTFRFILLPSGTNFANHPHFPYNTLICDYLELIMDQRRPA